MRRHAAAPERQPGPARDRAPHGAGGHGAACEERLPSRRHSLDGAARARWRAWSKPILERRSGKQAWRDFGLAFQPEFLREGSSIRDYDQPPFTVVGTPSERDAKILRELFGHLPCEFVHTQTGTAEMLKYACNSFHALKVTYAERDRAARQSSSAWTHAK